MPNVGISDFCPIEQEVRDSSFLFALQRLYSDTGGKIQFHYTFDDIPSKGDYCQMRYWICNLLLGAGVVATDSVMTHHLIYTILPIELSGVIFTEDYFIRD